MKQWCRVKRSANNGPGAGRGRCWAGAGGGGADGGGVEGGGGSGWGGRHCGGVAMATCRAARPPPPPTIHPPPALCSCELETSFAVCWSVSNEEILPNVLFELAYNENFPGITAKPYLK